MVKTSNRKLAILIDADNIQSNLLPGILKATEKYGKPMIRRVYGDWSHDDRFGWVNIAKYNSFELKQVTTHSTNKNATDIGMVIDTMDILTEGTMDGFCIVSNDSDFTELCIRLRNAGLFVMGVGNRNASKALRNACEEFVALDTIKSSGSKRRRGFYASKRNKNRRNALSIQQPDEQIETSDDTPNSRWSRLKSAVMSFTSTNEADTDETVESLENGSDWRSHIRQSATQRNTDKNQTSSPSNNNGTSSDWQRQLKQASSLRQGKPVLPTPSNSSQHTSTNNTPAETRNGNKPQNPSTPDVTSTSQQAESTSNQKPQSPAPIENKTSKESTDNKATKPTKTKPTDKSDKQAKNKTTKNKQVDSKSVTEAEYWQPFIEDLGNAYARYLILGLHHVVDTKDEWIPLNEITNYIRQLNPQLHYKNIGKRIIDMLYQHPNLVSVKSEGKGKSKKHFIKILPQQPTKE